MEGALQKFQPSAADPWDRAKAAHLLGRAGGTPEEVAKLAALPFEEALDHLLEYHLPPPTPDLDVYLTGQYANDSVAGVATTGYLVGAGVTQQLAPILKVYYTVVYHSQMQVGFFDFGAQYQLSRQWAVVGGVSNWELSDRRVLPRGVCLFRSQLHLRFAV